MTPQRPNGLVITGLIACLLGVFPGTHPGARAQRTGLTQPELITDRQGLPQAFVPSIIQDHQGFIWMATRDGLCRYDGHQFKVFQPDPEGRPSLSSADVAQIKPDHHGKLWMTNEQGQVDVFDPRTEQFRKLLDEPAFKSLPKTIPRVVNHVCVDRYDQIWMAQGTHGLLMLNRRTNQFHHFYHQPTRSQSLSNNIIIGLLEGPDGKIWVLTATGLDCIDPQTYTLRHFLNQPRQQSVFKGFWVRSSGDVLVAGDQWLYLLRPASGQVRSFALPKSGQGEGFTHFAQDRRGRVYMARNTELFRFTDQEGIRRLDGGNNLTPNAYLSAFVDQSDVLWLGTAGAGVRKYDLRRYPFQTARYQQEFMPDLLQHWLNLTPTKHPPNSPVLTSYNFRYTVDQQGRLWYNGGSSALCRADLRTHKTEKIALPISFGSGVIGQTNCPLATDPRGRVWAVYDTTAYWYDQPQGRWQPFGFRIPHPPGNLHQMLVVDAQALWLATSAGGLLRIERATGRTKTYTNTRHQPTSLPSNALLCLAADPDDSNQLWIGTFGNGLCRFDKRTGRAKRLSVTDGLPNNVIYSVIPDQRGDLWVGTNKGLARLNRRTLGVQTYTRPDGILADEFNRFHFLHLSGTGRSGPDSEERILMGGLEGITAFQPRQIQPDPFQPRVEMTTLYVNNKPVGPGPDSPLGELPVQAIHELTLPYDQNFIAVELAALQFNKPGKNQYRYQLIGLDTGWVESRRPEAVFTGLRPGQYVLRLNAANTNGRWSPHIRTLDLTITPPPWGTGWAYALYALLASGLLGGLVRTYTNRLRLQQLMRLRQQETDQLRAADALKNRFFANITHEFRTPLTLILGPTEQLMSEQTEPRNQRRLRTIEQNAHQLLRLINQLLDLSRLEAHLMPLHASRGDLTRCVAYWLEPLTQQAQTQGLTLTFEATLGSAYWFDTEKLEHIVYNLTANALKFTLTGTIAVSLAETTTGIRLTVTDTGVGIAAPHLPHIFDRFYQVGDPAGAVQQPGTGIGLALVNELVLLQQGTIRVQSVVDQGTRFVVELPYKKAAPIDQPAEPTTQTGADHPSSGATGDEDHPSLLIVEDNQELATFIAESLPHHYRIRRAVDGQDGLDQARQQLPDLIISDVMMPGRDGSGLDGFALCGQLKTDLRTSHIPLILLTAKATLESRMEGLTQGADEYLTKPFLVAELRLRVHNLLQQRARQRAWIRRQLTRADEPLTPQPLPDDPFLLRLYAELDTHLTNPALSVDTLMDALAMSRSTLHRKVKVLTGLSTNELIRNYRLRAATALLRQGHNSAETATQVGFDSPSYFARCFRELYGVSPGEFVRSQPPTGH